MKDTRVRKVVHHRIMYILYNALLPQGLPPLLNRLIVTEAANGKRDVFRAYAKTKA